MIMIMVMKMAIVMVMKMVMIMIRRNENNKTVCAHLCKHVWGYLVFIKDYKHYHIIYVHMVLPSGV